jgi:hypothetical protein
MVTVSLFDGIFFSYPLLSIYSGFHDHRKTKKSKLYIARDRLRAQNVAFEELIFPDEIHDLLRWSDWIRAYRATAEFFDRRLPASGERQ